MRTPTFRNMRFALGEGVPRHWHGGRRAVTAFFDGLSIFFPEGERFFVRSVLDHRDRIGDAELAQAVRAFAAQEGAHAREHGRYNEMLAARGYPIAELERRATAILALVSRVLPARGRLAATCALEHFTAVLATGLLGHPELMDGADPEMAALWRWHAAEEYEHRAVAFDVHRAAGGTHLERGAIMALATIIFWGKVVEHQMRMMHADGILHSPREWLDLLSFLFVEPGGLLRLLGPYLAYYRPGFHPTHLGDDTLLERWRREEGDARAAA